MNVFQQVKNALAEAKFVDLDIEAATLNLVEKLDKELIEAGYDPGPEVESALARLEDALTTFDSSKEAASTPAAEDEEEEEGEFGGFKG